MPLARRYDHPEVERRFLLATVPPDLTGGRLVVDRYLPGTRLRLREIRQAGSVTRKLGQKIREATGPERVRHTSTELDDAEWELLSRLGGQVLVKARHPVPLDGGGTVAVDVFGGRHAGLVLAEVDLAADGDVPHEGDELAPVLEAAGLRVVREVTAEEAFTGGALAAGASAVPWEAVVYERPGCGYCLRLEHALEDLAERVHRVDIWQDEAAAAFVRAVNAGAETVPTVVVGAEVWTNPDPARVVERLRGDSR
jgi:CYTH domain-containing protein/glutaredoxin